MEDEYRLRFNMPMHPVMAAPLQIQQAIAKYYAPGMRDDVDSPAEVGNGAGQPSGSRAKKGKKTRKPAKSKEPASGFDDLTEEEQSQRKQLGYIALCWAIIGGVMLDQYYLKPNILPEALSFNLLPSVGTLALGLIVFGWLKLVYWK